MRFSKDYVALLTGSLVLVEKFMNQSLQFALEAEDDVCIGYAYRGFGEIYDAKGEILLAKLFSKGKRSI